MKRISSTIACVGCLVTVIAVVWVSLTSALATDCKYACGPNTNRCAASYSAHCSGCLYCTDPAENSGAVRYYGPITRIDVPGSAELFMMPIRCKTVWPCIYDPTPYPSRKCISETLCDINYPGYSCAYCELGAGTDPPDATCTLETCEEE